MNVTGKSIAPPRLLQGIAFLYWGAVAGQPLIGLACAFLVEARWWVDWRWKFGEAGFSRAWKLSLLLMVLAGVWLWLRGESVFGIFDLMSWLPVLYLPVLLAQQYSEEEKMPLNTFSYVAKRKMQLDRKAGREVQPLQVHAGYAYYCLILIGACLAKPTMVVSFVAAVLLAGVGLFFASPLGRMRPVAWGAAVLAAVVMAVGGAAGVNVLWRFLHGGNLGLVTGQSIGDEAHTAIGMIGEIKQSYRIRWRIGMPSPGSTKLFQTAGFNRYGHGIWNHRPEPPLIYRSQDYEDMATVVSDDGVTKRRAFRRDHLQGLHGWRKHYWVKGAVQGKKPTPLPLMEGARVLTGVEADFVAYSPLGTVRVENPDRGVVEFMVDSGDGNLIENERAPSDRLDLHVPVMEEPGLERICYKLGLDVMADEDKVAALEEFFHDNFTYSLALDGGVGGGAGTEVAITEFLEYTRMGHCEYYATAAALLLRQAGVPTRYCEGFGAQEWDGESKEWILRAAHAHAWCRAYLGGQREERVGEDGAVEVIWSGGRWVDVDLTPSNWYARERQAGPPVLAQFIDWWQRMREDFLIWRTRSANQELVTTIMFALGVLIVLYTVRRLWIRRSRGEGEGSRGYPGGSAGIVTPLHKLEKKATKVLGPRPRGVTLTRWLSGLGDLLPGGREDLMETMALHWKVRFDPLGVEDAERVQLAARCRDLRKALGRLRRR